MRWIIVSKNVEVRSSANSNLADVGHQIVRNSSWVFADKTGFVGANGVEIAEIDDGEI